MKDDQPLDLSTWCNAGLEVLESERNVPIVVQVFRGLPFVVGTEQPDRDRCFILFDSTSENITIPINQHAYRTILAHCLPESHLEEGGPSGEQLAKYLFHLPCSGDDKKEKTHPIPIRERFEIALVGDNRRFGVVGTSKIG